MKDEQDILLAIKRLTTREMNSIKDLSDNSDFTNEYSLFVFTAREIACMAKIKPTKCLRVLENLESKLLIKKTPTLTSSKKPEFSRCWQSKEIKKLIINFKKNFS
ncbi:TPA: hypothetical protein ACX6RX_003148 [Photobacterium damselae]